ncbi:hypothetical protein [Novosphingobium soli]|uniref:DUF2585 family protein n=1 Tax=Novosphingobium soli TaxID=574956 RepID=A0ABV6CWV5_9SPHN
MAEPSWTAWLWMTKHSFQFAAFVLLFLYAVLRCDGPERVLAAVLLALPLQDRLYHALAGEEVVWARLDLGHLAIDLVTMACVYPVALRANRVYPLWIVAAQMIALLGHFDRYLIVGWTSSRTT